MFTKTASDVQFDNDFESETFPGHGWTVQSTRSDSPYTWYQGTNRNLNTTKQARIDMDYYVDPWGDWSVGSIRKPLLPMAGGSDKLQDEYLISPAVNLTGKTPTLNFDYLLLKRELISSNPAADIDAPRLRKTLPVYLNEPDAVKLLDAVRGPYAERDFCMLLLLLSCGMRVSELAGLNLKDVNGETVRVLGKGNKERILYLNPACQQAIQDYLSVRDGTNVHPKDQDALFLSRNHRRISVDSIQILVKRTCPAAGLDPERYSPHKLRHTAATLMLQNGVDVRTLQEVLGHESLNTTQIYTHIDNEGLRTAARANPIGRYKKQESATNDGE